MSRGKQSARIVGRIGAPTEQVTSYIDHYKTKAKGTPAERTAAEEFAKGLVRQMGPPSTNRAHDLLTAVARFAVWCQRAAIALDPKDALTEANIQRYIAEELKDLKPSTQKTVRANLRQVGSRLVRGNFKPDGVKIGRKRPGGPYPPSVIDEYIRLADSVAAKVTGRQLKAVTCLIAGADLLPEELRYARGSDVRMHGTHVVVDVRGGVPRTVPVLEPYGRLLFEIATAYPDDLLVGGRDGDRKNLTSRLPPFVKKHSNLPPYDATRLRDTWWVAHLEHLNIKAFLAAAGVTQTPRLFDLMAYVPEPSFEDALAVLRRSRK